jgi:hypothetical protein
LERAVLPGSRCSTEAFSIWKRIVRFVPSSAASSRTRGSREVSHRLPLPVSIPPANHTTSGISQFSLSKFGSTNSKWVYNNRRKAMEKIRFNCTMIVELDVPIQSYSNTKRQNVLSDWGNMLINAITDNFPTPEVLAVVVDPFESCVHVKFPNKESET